ncbi:hypothetical protein DFP73DRAFT_567971 [Morchella snyderi]|nr:hypothetical protein DFP73DRAFT_567971 [Morchella snyderi]
MLAACAIHSLLLLHTCILLHALHTIHATTWTTTLSRARQRSSVKKDKRYRVARADQSAGCVSSVVFVWSLLGPRSYTAGTDLFWP